MNTEGNTEMAFHITKSGSMELVDKWGHGKAARADWRNTPCTLVVDDGDGHYDAWKVEGAMLDAAHKACEWAGGNDSRVAIYGNGSLHFESRYDWPEGFEIEILDEDGDVIYTSYDFSKYPGAIALV